MRLGEMLCQKGLISQEQLKTVLQGQSRFGGRLGTNLVQLGYVEVDVVAMTLSEKHAVSPVLREHVASIDKKTIGQALKGATDQQQGQFFRNMSGRAVEMMKEEMELMGPVKIKDVHASQQRIVEVVRKLEEEGVINLGAGSGDEYVL